MLNIDRFAAVLMSVVLAAGCAKAQQHSDHDGGPKPPEGKAGAVAVANIRPAQAAATQPSYGSPTGRVTFTQMGDEVKVVARITGLPPGKHGFHIHEKGDVSAPDLMSAGGHFNPGGHMHGGPTTSPVHAGDLGNITADAAGNANYELTVHGLSIGTGEPNDILGRSVMIHDKEDDLSSQPTGASGARIAGGKIEKPEK